MEAKQARKALPSLILATANATGAVRMVKGVLLARRGAVGDVERGIDDDQKKGRTCSSLTSLATFNDAFNTSCSLGEVASRMVARGSVAAYRRAR